MATADDMLRAIDDIISDGVRRGMLHNVAEDEWLDGRTVTLRGRRLVNFGSCSYLGLETHPALKAAVHDAVERYGTQFSSSRAYLSAPPYAAAERLLGEVFGRPTLITPSTTLGHLAALPTLLGPRDALLLDHQVHHSVQTAAKLTQSQGTLVELVPHSDVDALARRVAELARERHRIWYAADGLYSMYADFAPMAALNALAAEHEQLHLYLDDAHGVSWTGRHGRGHVLEHLAAPAAARTVVAASLNKSFAAAGGALVFPDTESLRRVRTVGGPMIFAGPVQPPMLGAVLGSGRLHLSPEVAGRQARLRALIQLFNQLSAERGLPLLSTSEAPIRYVGAGGPAVAYNLTGRLLAAGFFVDTASYPAVAAKRSGARLTLTAHHTDADVAALVDALATALPAALADEGGSPEALATVFARQLGGRPVRLDPPATVTAPAGTGPVGTGVGSGARPGTAPDGPGADQPGPERPVDDRSVDDQSGYDWRRYDRRGYDRRRADRRREELRLERHTTIGTVDRDEWDRLLGDRGAFGWAALRTLERTFTVAGAPPEESWRFNYWIVRDRAGAPVAATFFTTTRWKDDLMSAAAVSAEVERRRQRDPYFLTSTVVGMGSLLTEGDHLYLDRSADWRGALRLVLDAARDEEDVAGAAAVAVRDLPEDDPELHEFLVAEGFLRLPTWSTWERPVDFTDDAEFLAGLRKKARYHQRTHVLAWEGRYQVAAVAGGSAAASALTEADRDHLYGLYRNVHARALELNVFPVPRRLLDAVLADPCWELLLLRLTDGGPNQPVAFALQYVGADHVQPVFIGLDYDYVASHHAYQQTLWQAIRSAQRHRVGKVLFGMSADLHKSRFGARPRRRVVYLQPTEQYQVDVLNHITETISVRAA